MEPLHWWEALGRGTRVAILFSILLSLGVALAVRETLHPTLDAARLMDDTAQASTTAGLTPASAAPPPVSTGTLLAPPAPSAGGPGLSEPPPGLSIVLTGDAEGVSPGGTPAGGMVSYTPSVPATVLPADPEARRRALTRQVEALRRESSRLHTVEEAQQIQARLSATLAQLEAMGGN